MAEKSQKNLARVHEENQKYVDSLFANMQTKQEEFQALHDKYQSTFEKLHHCENPQ